MAFFCGMRKRRTGVRELEVLAPAGTFETMQAAVRAGADAVYLGGGRFGARAYAGNLDQEQLLRAIDYVHLHGRKLYLTVNTLLKEQELEEQLYSWLKPFYEQGLDAVIVQDLGVLSLIRREFPALAVHASTQMTVAGPEGARLLEECGASRLVLPRELSLSEIRQIRQGCGLEIEGFVHGALCYCYSGQCLMSSMIGGRSGNRGRCAQPCRLNYRAFEGKNSIGRADEPHLLSPKDMNTLAILPDIIEAGVTSLKIEGRMKKPVYTAGVTEVYRKYADRYLEYGRSGYRVDAEDEKQLWDLFHRNGFHQSYYKQHNGKNMMALSEKEFRFRNEPLAKRLQETYLEREKKVPVQMEVQIKAGEPVLLKVSAAKDGCRESVSVTVEGDVPQAAIRQPATEDSIRRQLGKLGGTEYAAEKISVSVEDRLFLPVVQLNELRRQGLAKLTKEAVEGFRRKDLPEESSKEIAKNRCTETEGNLRRAEEKPLRVLAVTLGQAEVLLESGRFSRIYVESEAAEEAYLESFAKRCRQNGTECFLAMPYVLRDRARTVLEQWKKRFFEHVFDGFLARSLDELCWLRENIPEESRIVADCGLYSWNREAVSFLHRLGAEEDTVPLELNRREIVARGAKESELVIYGRAPMMVSAQCVRKNTSGCRPGAGMVTLTDRMGEAFPVRPVCRYCYNVIYNSRPLSLFTQTEEIESLNPAALRLSFSTETEAEIKEIIEKCFREDPQGFTRGHWKRGVE